MPQRIGPKDLDVSIRFGGGLHTRASEDEIDPREAAGGKNFLLDLENRELRCRPPFDLVGVVPNAAEIRGGGSLLTSGGIIKTFFQAGDTVYEWDGATTFTSIGSVNATARLRGHWRSHNWQLDDVLLVTDMELTETVKQWDGATWADVAFTNEAAAAFGAFYAKYLSISHERAVFANTRDAGGFFPQMMVGAERSNYQVITVNQRPGGDPEDPFFLVTPDIKPINGLVEAFGSTIISTEKGQLFNLTGFDASDFSFTDFYAGSSASGAESMAYVGNDIFYGRAGRIESVRDTDRFGDSEADDLTSGIADQVADYTGWRIVYNSRLNRAYLFPSGISECWVYNIAMRGGKLSPWMRWRTDHSLAFLPTFVMAMLDPADGLEYVFMGDSSGHIYRLEGRGAGDGGATAIATEWLTRLFVAPLDAEFYRIEGYVKYRKNVAFNIDMTFEYAGYELSTQGVSMTVPTTGITAWYFGGNYYWGGNIYWGASAINRLLRQRFQAAGQASDFQVRINVNSPNAFALNEIGLRFIASSQ
jgi:hypothetical protein